MTVTRSSQPLPVELPYGQGLALFDVSSWVKVYVNACVPPSVGAAPPSHKRPVSVTVSVVPVKLVPAVIGRL